MNDNRREFYMKHVLQFTSDDNIDLTIFLNVNLHFVSKIIFFSVQHGLM